MLGEPKYKIPSLKMTDYENILMLLDSRAELGGFINLRNIFISKMFIFTAMKIGELLTLKPEDFEANSTIYFGPICNGVQYKLNPKIFKDDVERYFSLREESEYIFYHCHSISDALGSRDMNNYLIELFREIGINPPKALSAFIKDSHRKVKPFETASYTKDMLDDVREMKKAMTEHLKNPIRLKLEKHTYICNKCGSEGVCYAKSIEEFMETVSEREKLCLDCIEKNIEEKKAKERKSTNRKSKDEVNPQLKECGHCQKEFMSAGDSFCSDRCRRKNREKKLFYGALQKANNEVEISKVRVYGQGRTEYISATKSPHSKRMNTVHQGAVPHLKKGEDKDERSENYFEECIEKEAKDIISSHIGKELGLDHSMLDELKMEAMKIHYIEKYALAKRCVEAALGR